VVEAVFVTGVMTGVIILAVALAIYSGIADAIERNKENKEWMKAQYGSFPAEKLTPSPTPIKHPTSLEKDYWTYSKEGMQRITDNEE